MKSVLAKKQLKGLFVKKCQYSFPGECYSFSWQTPIEQLHFLYNIVLWKKPRVIIETGTFVGHAAFAMAAAASCFEHSSILHTIDYDGDPTLDPSGTLCVEEWNSLKMIRELNLIEILKFFPSVKLKFHDGDSRNILPHFLEQGIEWDFWYQDSMHHFEGIKEEWDLMNQLARNGAVIVFDDIGRWHPFVRYLKNRFGSEWSLISIKKNGHSQTIAQKLYK